MVTIKKGIAMPRAFSLIPQKTAVGRRTVKLRRIGKNRIHVPAVQGLKGAAVVGKYVTH